MDASLTKISRGGSLILVTGCGVLLITITSLIVPPHATNVAMAAPYGAGAKIVANMSQLDAMICMCYKSICKEWMQECHWVCDKAASEQPPKDTNTKGKLRPMTSNYIRCMECLGPSAKHCFECFEI